MTRDEEIFRTGLRKAAELLVQHAEAIDEVGRDEHSMELRACAFDLYKKLAHWPHLD